MSPISRTAPLPLHVLARNWWIVLLRGICAVIFGVLALLMPGVTLLTLVILYGVYALVDGVIALIAAFRAPGIGSNWWLALIGLCGIGAGLLTFLWPGLSALVLLYFIAAWAIIAGVFEIAGAIALRKEITNEWLLILSGAVSILFGLVLVFRPGEGALALVWLIGSFSLLFGILLIVAAFRLRKHNEGGRLPPSPVIGP